MTCMWIITLTYFFSIFFFLSVTVQLLAFLYLTWKFGDLFRSRSRCFVCVVSSWWQSLSFLYSPFFSLHGATQASQESFDRVVKQHMNRCLWMINVLLFLSSKEKCASSPPPPPSPNPLLLSSSELLCRPGVPLLLCTCNPLDCSCCPSLSSGGKPAKIICRTMY